ncbi:MAG: hypothetical protein JW847_05990 [Candidatus Omnitrophica bacterium]|nr:hypothetical protein [Candidatus Omnitrophota bacterium]
MRKYLFIFFFIICLASWAHAQQTITLSTYYPAPFGSYERLRLVPRAPAPPCNASLEGLMYLNNTTDEIEICLNGAWVPSLSPWIHSSVNDFVYLANLDKDNNAGTNPRVGIRTNSPTQSLDVVGNATVGDNTNGTSREILMGSDPNAFIELRQTGGSGGTPYIDFTNDNATNYDMRLMLVGDDALAIDGGNVGIGSTVLPTAPLHLRSATDGICNLQTTDNTWLYTQWLDSAGTRRLRMGLNNGLTAFEIQPENGTANMILGGTGGFVGIGEAAPVAKLDVQGDVNVDGTLVVNGDIDANDDIFVQDRIEFDGGGYIYDDGWQLIIGHN